MVVAPHPRWGLFTDCSGVLMPPTRWPLLCTVLSGSCYNNKPCPMKPLPLFSGHPLPSPLQPSVWGVVAPLSCGRVGPRAMFPRPISRRACGPQQGSPIPSSPCLCGHVACAGFCFFAIFTFASVSEACLEPSFPQICDFLGWGECITKIGQPAFELGQRFPSSAPYDSGLEAGSIGKEC